MARSLSTRLRRAPTQYVPSNRIAAGGMAEVWRGEAVFEDGDRHPVAIKRVLPHLVKDSVFRTMFEDEARLGMALSHQNIVRVYDARNVGGTYIMIMEFVDGTSLKDLLEKAHERGAPMPLAPALHITVELARALSYAHRATDATGQSLGVVHRDVSPHNLLLSRQGHVKLADFGLADATVHETHLGDGMLGGKLGYLAPEIIRQEPNTSQVDVFAMGIVLWELLCGRRLFQGETDEETVKAVVQCDVPLARDLNPSVPSAVDDLLRQLLHPDPHERTESSTRAVAELESLIATVDRKVGPRDVALLVGLHIASRSRPLPPPAGPLADLLIQELAAFAEAAAGSATALGAEPLDPDAFLMGD